MKIELLAAVLAYFALLLAAGLLVPKRFRDLDAFFLASRRLGAPRVAFSLCAAWVGAASLLVSTDQAFLEGVSAFWMIGLPAVVTLFLLLPLAGALRSLGVSTLSDAMEAHYGPAARPATTFLIVWYMTVLAASQMVAAGNFLKTFLGTSYLAGLAVSAAVVLLYLGAGGFLSVVRTQTVQFFLLAAGIAALAASLWLRSSWADVAAQSSRQGRLGYFDFLAHADRNFLIALSFVLAWTISPIAWQRIQAARSESSARRGAVAAALLLGLFYSGIVLAGMLFLPLFPGAKPSNPLIAEYIGHEAGAVLGGLVFVTVMAAILSTMSAALNSGAFSLAGDLLRYRKQTASDRGSVAMGRAATLLVGGAAFLVATRFEDILTTLGLASQIMAEGLFIPGLAALLMRKRAPLAGLLSLFAGGGYALACFLAEAGLFSLPVPPWPQSLPLGLATSAAGFILGLLAGSSRKSEPSAN